MILQAGMLRRWAFGFIKQVLAIGGVMEEHFTFGVHSLGLLEKCKASFEGEGCTCTVTVCTHTVGKMHFELHTLACVRPPHPPVRFTPAKGE